MPQVRLPVDVVRGVPVVTAPEEIDITNAASLRAALLEAAAHGRGAMVADMSSTRLRPGELPAATQRTRIKARPG